MSFPPLLIYEKSPHRAAELRGIAEEAGFRCRTVFYRAEAETVAGKDHFALVVAGFDLFPLPPALEGMRVAVAAPEGETKRTEDLFSRYKIAGPLITYPFDRRRVTAALRRMAEGQQQPAAAHGGTQDDIPAIIGDSEAMRGIKRLLLTAATVNGTVLITGETGTGKELAARALHDHGPRRAGPFVAVNCAAIPESLIESELFGHERGAFTGADRRHSGKFEMAHKGTIFLDEVGELSPSMQVKLLRVLEERRFHRVGGETLVEVDVRVVCATNRDILEMTRVGAFRRDLLYRINVIAVHLPPLRERGADIMVLAERFLRAAAASAGKTIAGFSAGATAALRAHPWPGNIRELENVVERSVLHCAGDSIEAVDFYTATPETISGRAPLPGELVELSYDAMKEKVLDHYEREYVTALLRRSAGSMQTACDLSGMDRKTLYRKMKEFGLDKKDFKE